VEEDGEEYADPTDLADWEEVTGEDLGAEETEAAIKILCSRSTSVASRAKGRSSRRRMKMMTGVVVAVSGVHPFLCP
jgi:hypothetical protein